MPELAVPDATLHYEVAGDGSSVLFIQGVGVAGTGWNPQTDQLSREFQCLSFDNRGIGKSTAQNLNLSIEQMTSDALEILDRVGCSSAHVVGHSMGGVIAQHLALTAPSRVKSLALLCTFASGSEATSMSLPILWLAMRGRIGTARMRRRAFLEMLFPKEYLDRQDSEYLAAQLKTLLGRDLAEQPPIVLKQLRALGAYDASGRLGELSTIPTVVISANFDPIARPRYGQRLSHLIRGSNFIELAAASHGVTIQMPEVINELLHKHFQTAEARHVSSM